jgi:prepilin-type N-terminal cleavage/methylation domain-containing protein
MRLIKLKLLIYASKSSAGFTLIELIVAMMLSAILMGMTSYGLFLMTNKNLAAEAETQRRTQLNRALEYISEDIRMARVINPASSYTISSVTPTCAIATPILSLTIPDGAGIKTVVYYLNDLSSCTSAQTVWLKSGVIKRVDLGSSVSTNIIDGNGQELVDAISNTVAPTCASGTISPATNAKGFYVCLDNPTNARKVELHLRAKLSAESSEIYQVSSQAFARSQ